MIFFLHDKLQGKVGPQNIFRGVKKLYLTKDIPCSLVQVNIFRFYDPAEYIYLTRNTYSTNISIFVEKKLFSNLTYLRPQTPSLNE